MKKPALHILRMSVSAPNMSALEMKLIQQLQMMTKMLKASSESLMGLMEEQERMAAQVTTL